MLFDEALCKNIQSSDKSIRQHSLTQLLNIVRKTDNNSELNHLFSHVYLHVFKCYGDRYEVCRSLAVLIVSGFMEKSSDCNDSVLEYIIPLLKTRIGQQKVIENSEELRLLLIEQLCDIIKQFGCYGDKPNTPIKSYNETIEILLRTLLDPYARILVQSCNAIELLQTETPSPHVNYSKLVDPLINILIHRHSSVRISAVKALGKYQ